MAAFVEAIKHVPVPHRGGRRGRLVFALDATMSRQPTWDLATRIQAEMFEEVSAVGGLSVQLVYFRGFREFSASPWVADAAGLGAAMTGVDCRGGKTQLGRVLAHVREEAARETIAALVYVGDCFEEQPDPVLDLAGELGMRGVRAFLFQEGRDARAARVFRGIAQMTHGAYAPFDAGSAAQLRALLRAVAAYAAGGMAALSDHASRAGGAAMRLLKDMR